MKKPFDSRAAPTAIPMVGLPDSTTPAMWLLNGARSLGQTGSRCSLGFSVIELIITLAVVVILTVVAMPSFTSLIYSNKLTSTSNDMVAALHLARLEAVKRNATVQLCSNSASINATDTLGAACAT